MTASNPLVEALARTILRHQLGCDQPAEPPAWMAAAAAEIAAAFWGYLIEADERQDVADELNRRPQ